MEITDPYIPNEIMNDSEIPLPLSTEYFDLLQNRYLPNVSSNETAEKITNLLLAPEIPHILSTSASPSQAYQYLLSIPKDLVVEPFIFHDVLPGILLHIRCACLLLSSQNQAKITQSGILIKLAKLAGNITHDDFLFSRYPTENVNTNVENASFSINPSESTKKQPTSNGYSFSGDVHVDFLRICVMAGQYYFARLHFCPLVNTGYPLNSSLSEDTVESSVDMVKNHQYLSNLSLAQYRSSVMENIPFIQNVETYLYYRYFRGIIYYELDEIHSAVQEWSMCITTPARAIHDIVIEAYKKLILARGSLSILYEYDGLRMDIENQSLESIQKSHSKNVNAADELESKSHIEISKIICVPRGTSGVVSRKLKSLASGKLKIYPQIIDAVINGDDSLAQSLMHSLESNGGITAKDTDGEYLLRDNIAMARRFIGLINLQKLRSVARAYDAIPLSNLAAKLNIYNAEDCIDYLVRLNMKQLYLESSFSQMHSGEPIYSPVRFSIDEQSGVVYFDELEDDQYHLERDISDYMKIAERVKKLDISITTSTKYQNQVKRNDSDDMHSLFRGKETAQK